ncbi:thiolase family protein (plasmid) [Agrobacterium tumefaciens]|uniref:Beta-ketothiolase n=1 Tax=Agrobacterium tumefaciens TaxID=358 RepID=A0AAJ4N817_AGRTU|nr:thiolase family protein [Agrobacterium tumefaciens]
MREVILASCVRTPIGNYNGVFKGTPATDLGAAVIRAALLQSKADPASVGSVVMGNVIQAGNRMNPARQAAIGGGLPVSVPAQTVNRVCGSGAQAIISAAQEIHLGLHDLAIAGGMENMDRAPYLIDGGRWGYRMGNAALLDSMLHDGLNDAFTGEHSGWHTEDLVTHCQITRDDQDRWAERSQKRFIAASEQGLFNREIVDVTIEGRKGAETISLDETPRPETSQEKLAKLRPAFRKGGTITAGNAPGLNSAASAMLVADRSMAERNGIAPMARLVSYAVAAVEPGLFGLGPVPAVKLALARAEWKLSEVDRFEINEAFAAVPLAVIKELGLPEDTVNVYGGAIAHGHAIGATGAILTTRLLHSMALDGARRGVVTLCIGGGQGIALAFETI